MYSCPNCKKDLPIPVKFCAYCGHDFNAEIVSPEDSEEIVESVPDNRGSRKLLIACGVAGCAAVAIWGTVLFQGLSTGKFTNPENSANGGYRSSNTVKPASGSDDGASDSGGTTSTDGNAADVSGASGQPSTNPSGSTKSGQGSKYGQELIEDQITVDEPSPTEEDEADTDADGEDYLDDEDLESDEDEMTDEDAADDEDSDDEDSDVDEESENDSSDDGNDTEDVSEDEDEDDDDDDDDTENEDSGASLVQVIKDLLVATPDYILPDSDTKYLSMTDLQDLDEESCRIAENELYARHGLIFEEDDLAEYFGNLSWYKAEINEDDFDESVLNEYEVANRDLIQEYASEKGFQLEGTTADIDD